MFKKKEVSKKKKGTDIQTKKKKDKPKFNGEAAQEVVEELENLMNQQEETQRCGCF